ncbi:MAG: threonine/serine dehydratase [Streptosporangiales bacterium]|nr:threonine/serine dehydratase [Streptosporangiales bacterium]
MADLVPVAEVRAAARRLDGVAVRTPLLPVPALTPANLLIKPESLQPTGAFKLRGAYNAIAALGETAKPAGIVTHSSGNHGFAIAYAAARLGVPAAIVVPETAPEVKTAAIERAGAELIRVEPTLDARLAGCDKIAQERGYAVVPPFDHPLVIAGQGTIGLEIAEDLRARPPGAVLVPVSGGGLISGIAVAVKAAFPETRVIGVEPELAADARESLKTGTRVRWASGDVARTRADALRVEQVGELTFAHMRELVSDIVTVTEDEITGAIRRLARQARLVAEPGGAVAVAAALNRTAGELGVPRDDESPVVAVLSGGNIDPALLTEILGSSRDLNASAGRSESYTG